MSYWKRLNAFYPTLRTIKHCVAYLKSKVFNARVDRKNDPTWNKKRSRKCAHAVQWRFDTKKYSRYLQKRLDDRFHRFVTERKKKPGRCYFWKRSKYSGFKIKSHTGWFFSVLQNKERVWSQVIKRRNCLKPLQRVLRTMESTADRPFQNPFILAGKDEQGNVSMGWKGCSACQIEWKTYGLLERFEMFLRKQWKAALKMLNNW